MDNFHKICVNNRKDIEITGVVDVNSYNEEEIDLQTNCGNLVILGNSFNVKKLDVESGIMLVEGHLDSFTYTDYQETSNISIFKRLFK